MAKWHFKKHDPYDDIKASTASESFMDGTVRGGMATALIREGIQNALDARRDDLPQQEPVRVRLALTRAHNNGSAITLNSDWFSELIPHLHKPDVGAPERPTRDEHCNILIFEDFGTTGLTGDYKSPYEPDSDNNFVNFMYHEGITDKSNNKRGSRGVGKIVFTMASRARTFFAYTIRQNEPDAPILIGKNLLKFREINGIFYRGSAYCLEDWPDANKPRLPITNPEIYHQFRNHFPLSRKDELGLSIVIPFLDSTVTYEELRYATISEYHYAILSGALEVTIIRDGKEEIFNTSYVPRIGKNDIDAKIDLARWAVTQTAPSPIITEPPEKGEKQYLKPEHVSNESRNLILETLDQRQRIAVRLQVYVHPKNSGPILTCFDVFLEYSDTSQTKPVFIRALLPVSNVKNAKSAVAHE